MHDEDVPGSLLIPPVDGNPIRIHRTSRPPFRGQAARRRAILEEEQKQRNFEALMHTMVTCGTLWGGFWFQFVISFLYNNPALHTFSHGNWYAPYVGFYLPVRGTASISLAESFVWLSVFGSVMALVGVWLVTREVRGRWRMRILVAGFAGFLSLWAVAAWAAEDSAWQALEDRLVEVKKEMERTYDVESYRWKKREKEGVERMLEMRTQRE